MGAIGRYFAQEAAPVGKDTFNDLATETRPGVRAAVFAIAEGLTQGGRQSPPAIVCAKCCKVNDADATYCDGCGKRRDPNEPAVQ